MRVRRVSLVRSSGEANTIPRSPTVITETAGALGATMILLLYPRLPAQRLVAERAGLRQQRDNVRLLAPADGVVISRDSEVGSTVVAGQAVLRLIEPGSLWVRVRRVWAAR